MIGQHAGRLSYIGCLGLADRDCLLPTQRWDLACHRTHNRTMNSAHHQSAREQEKFYVSLWAQWWTRVCRQRPRLGYSSPAGEERSQCAVVVTRVSKTACPHISSIYDITCPAGATLLWTHAWYVTIRNLAGAERRAVTTRGAGAFASAQSTTTLGHSTCFLNDW